MNYYDSTDLIANKVPSGDPVQGVGHSRWILEMRRGVMKDDPAGAHLGIHLDRRHARIPEPRPVGLISFNEVPVVYGSLESREGHAMGHDDERLPPVGRQ